ncbi:MAG: hypothetical protein K2H91_05500, partial [Lachnospiraceae bacterium]|nr:hypothetical protein [Lachnospiraceae bacterium]
ISTIQGDITCHNKAEIEEIMKKGAAQQKGDEIWISGDDEKYPCLNILVKGKYACVHYFEDEGDVLQSCGDDFDDEVVFLAGGEEWAAPEDTIISFKQAVKCMEEFFDTMECPECIEWDEL